MNVQPNRESCKAVYVPPEQWNDGEGHAPGAFTVETWTNGQRAMLFNCPSDGSERLIRLRPCSDEGPSWEFNGDLERPTLSPSVHRQVMQKDGSLRGTVWHGWLRNGEWVSC